MKIDPIDETTCRIVHDSEDAKLYVRKNGLTRVLDERVQARYEIYWTPLKSNAEVFTHEEFDRIVEEMHGMGVRELLVL